MVLVLVQRSGLLPLQCLDSNSEGLCGGGLGVDGCGVWRVADVGAQ